MIERCLWKFYEKYRWANLLTINIPISVSKNICNCVTNWQTNEIKSLLHNIRIPEIFCLKRCVCLKINFRYTTITEHNCWRFAQHVFVFADRKYFLVCVFWWRHWKYNVDTHACGTSICSVTFVTLYVHWLSFDYFRVIRSLVVYIFRNLSKLLELRTGHSVLRCCFW
jgi:hypothetical protein